MTNQSIHREERERQMSERRVLFPTERWQHMCRVKRWSSINRTIKETMKNRFINAEVGRKKLQLLPSAGDRLLQGEWYADDFSSLGVRWRGCARDGDTLSFGALVADDDAKESFFSCQQGGDSFWDVTFGVAGCLFLSGIY